jgi:hypothetical protein
MKIFIRSEAQETAAAVLETIASESPCTAAPPLIPKDSGPAFRVEPTAANPRAGPANPGHRSRPASPAVVGREGSGTMGRASSGRQAGRGLRG